MDSLLGMIFLFAFGHPFYTLLSDRLSARRVRRSL